MIVCFGGIFNGGGPGFSRSCDLASSELLLIVLFSSLVTILHQASFPADYPALHALSRDCFAAVLAKLDEVPVLEEACYRLPVVPTVAVLLGLP
jgi:hypothetical protein